MNSLNLITARVSPSSSPTSSRSNSTTSLNLASDDTKPSEDEPDKEGGRGGHTSRPVGDMLCSSYDEKTSVATEDTPLLHETKDLGKRSHWWHRLPRHLASGIISSIRWVFATIASPGVYLIACFYDEDGNFAPIYQLKKLFGYRGNAKKLVRREARAAAENDGRARSKKLRHRGASSHHGHSSSSSSSGASSESDDEETRYHRDDHDQTQSEESANNNRRSIRIKLNNDEAMRERKHQRTQSQLARLKAEQDDDLSAHLKSPTSPATTSTLTRYPKTPAPPRPLIPRRQPSYLNIEVPKHQRKTLVLDLDETLIHSMSKGGRMSTGHMVEVRLNAVSLGPGMGPQHPILYWVNKRPYCDEFLRRVFKWFNLVIFTASVQEYADPVIDWLEQERKFFSARYYRQHCTFRQGAYIKDLSSVEPDLSNVMILDNSPLSYLFHEDNAIPIQGWINDPTDNDLMHLVPMLEGLQYVHDVRALLALRGGEDGSYSA